MQFLDSMKCLRVAMTLCGVFPHCDRKLAKIVVIVYSITISGISLWKFIVYATGLIALEGKPQWIDMFLEMSKMTHFAHSSMSSVICLCMFSRFNNLSKFSDVWTLSKKESNEKFVERKSTVVIAFAGICLAIFQGCIRTSELRSRLSIKSGNMSFTTQLFLYPLSAEWQRQNLWFTAIVHGIANAYATVVIWLPIVFSIHCFHLLEEKIKDTTTDLHSLAIARSMTFQDAFTVCKTKVNALLKIVDGINEFLSPLLLSSYVMSIAEISLFCYVTVVSDQTEALTAKINNWLGWIMLTTLLVYATLAADKVRALPEEWFSVHATQAQLVFNAGCTRQFLNFLKTCTNGQRMSISASEYFTINRALLTAIIGGIIAFILMLITQFNMNLETTSCT